MRHTFLDKRNFDSTQGTAVTPVPEEKIPFHFHSTFPAKPANMEIPNFRTFGNKKRPETEVSSLFSLSRVGGDKRDRTADLLNAIQALSQLSYTPKCVCSPTEQVVFYQL